MRNLSTVVLILSIFISHVFKIMKETDMPENNDAENIKSEDNSGKEIPCSLCGDKGEQARVTDKVKYKNKNAGTFYIRFKNNQGEGMLCRICWQKNLQSMIDKMNGPNEKYVMKKSMTS